MGTEAYFRDYAWPTTFKICVNCHVTGGEADGTRFILRPEAAENYIAQNMAVVSEAAALVQDGQSLLVLKPTLAVAHGGKQQILAESKELAVLEETLARLATPVTCPGDTVVRPVLDGVGLMDPYQTLRKASWQLASRPPTPAEVAAVDAGGLEALDAILTAQMQEPAFDERVREMFSDVLLTDGFRAGNSSNSSIVNNDYYESSAVDYWGGPDWDWHSWPRGEGIRLVEALAREPVEFFVRAAKANHSLSEALTAKHRLLNAYSARFFKLPYKGFAPGTSFASIPNPTEYVPFTQVPGINEIGGQGEYAGVLTTSAFLLRYPSSPTNFNRKRARFTYKFFLDFDIMKTAPRIDASAVDLNDYPTRRNPQCTGCHTQIDPLAGAYMNQDECGYVATVVYQSGNAGKGGECQDNGWVSADHMFAPGVGPGDANALTLADRPKALEKLAAHIVTQPGFVNAMVHHVYRGLIGRPLLQAAADPSAPEYNALNAAYDSEQGVLRDLRAGFTASGMRMAPLVIAIVKSATFRAASSDDVNRLELLALGGGQLVSPQLLDRKLRAVTGFGFNHHLWGVTGPTADQGYQRLGRHDGSEDSMLLQREEMMTIYGGMDGSPDGIKVRAQMPNTLTAAVIENMALQMACETVTRDFDKALAARKLFPLVEKTLAPNGNAADASQAPIIENLRYLHERILGERLSATDPELLATYQLLSSVRADNASAGAALERPCANDIDLGLGSPVNGTVSDPGFVIRAWQAVIAYMLMDYRFVFEQ